MLPQENQTVNDPASQSPLFPLQTQLGGSMVPYPRFPYQQAPQMQQMDYYYFNYYGGYSDGYAPYLLVQTQPMDAGKLSEYINPLMQQRIQKAHLAHQFPESRAAGSTVMCQSWLETASCKYGADCKFAHGETELRYARPPIKNPKKYKTRLCEKYAVRGVCPYGNRCLFIHPDPSQMMAVPPPPGLGMSSEAYKNYVTIPQLPRLMNYLVPPMQPCDETKVTGVGEADIKPCDVTKTAGADEAEIKPAKKEDEAGVDGGDKQQQSTSFNESGQQRDNLAYTLASVLDLSDA